MRALIPALEMLSWERLAIEARVHPWRDSDGYTGGCAAAAAGLTVRRLGVEGQRMRVFEEFAVAAALPRAEIVDAQQAISRMRLHKDVGEIELLRRAIAISEQALEKTLAAARVGVTEREVESVLVRELFAAGAEALSFPPIVVAGAQSAEGHGHAGDYRIRAGDTLLFDFGAAVGGYNADVTRTVFVGEPSAEARALYETVYEANRIGRAFARPGVTAGAVDDAVQSFLEKSPLRRGRPHQDRPRPRSRRARGAADHARQRCGARAGMVFTIEPGLYLPAAAASASRTTWS